jgi:hypothetical protein
MFEYAAKLVCGLPRDPRDRRLIRASYATTINIHNPNNDEVEFFKKLALTFPPRNKSLARCYGSAKMCSGPIRRWPWTAGISRGRCYREGSRRRISRDS